MHAVCVYMCMYKHPLSGKIVEVAITISWNIGIALNGKFGHEIIAMIIATPNALESNKTLCRVSVG